MYVKTSGDARIRQHASKYVNIRHHSQSTSARNSRTCCHHCQHTSVDVIRRQYTLGIRILFDFGFEQDDLMTLYQDSRPVITMTDNSVNRKGSRHIDTLK